MVPRTVLSLLESHKNMSTRSRVRLLSTINKDSLPVSPVVKRQKEPYDHENRVSSMRVLAFNKSVAPRDTLRFYAC